MERPKSRADVAVFVDFENVYVSVREKFDAQPNFELIMDRCEDFGRIVLARAYADWYRYPRVTSALFANGVEPMYVPTYYYDREVGRTGRPIKNSVDIHLCIDAMRTLYTQTHIDKFVLVTGDRDFIPLVNAIRQHGKEVIIIGIGGAASAHLAQSGDEFLFYEQIADLKTPQQARQEQVVRQPERREREKPERADRSDRERVESNGKVDGKRKDGERAERKEVDRPVAQPEAPREVEAMPERSYYDTLVDAINLARQRGFVSNLGSLKVLMRELHSEFNESKVKDANGRPFSKFKDFVKEAERLGKVQIFTNGTVTEVFLPGENPLDVSQFAEDLASQQAERELESELEQEEARHAPLPDPIQDVEALPDVVEDVEQAVLPGVPDVEPEALHVAPVEQAFETPTPREAVEPRPTFGEREWQIFRGSMSQFTDPVRFADIFSALRGLRNQEVFDLTNNELKELVKQAINRGMLQRTGRGARAYYRLSSQYRASQDDMRAAAQAEAARVTPRATSAGTQSEPAVSEVQDSAAGQVSEEGLAPAARRRRGRTYDVFAPSDEGALSDADTLANGAAPASTVDTVFDTAPTLNEVVAEQIAVQTADEPAPTKPRRNRRKKAAPKAEERADPTPASTEETVAANVDQPEQTAEPADADAANAAGNNKKRRSRRKKTTSRDEDGATSNEGGEQA